MKYILTFTILILNLSAKIADNDIGKNIFINKCAACHNNLGHGIIELEVPPIAGLPRWYVNLELRKFQTSERGNSKIDKESKKMREVTATLTDKDIAFLGRYVASLKPIENRRVDNVGNNVAPNKEIYDNRCASCHHPKGYGNKKLKAPPLVFQSNLYLRTQLYKFNQKMRSHYRGDHQTLSESQVNQIVSYLMTLKPQPLKK